MHSTNNPHHFAKNTLLISVAQLPQSRSFRPQRKVVRIHIPLHPHQHERLLLDQDIRRRQVHATYPDPAPIRSSRRRHPASRRIPRNPNLQRVYPKQRQRQCCSRYRPANPSPAIPNTNLIRARSRTLRAKETTRCCCGGGSASGCRSRCRPAHDPLRRTNRSDKVCAHAQDGRHDYPG